MTTSHDHLEGLRPRRCCEPNCNVIFSVCAGCDRGQRYCSSLCRSRQRRKQFRAAGQRYQSGEAGRVAHRRRQHVYRERHREARVTHQALATITSSGTPEPRSLTQCAICGQWNHWISPFTVWCHVEGYAEGRRRSKFRRFQMIVNTAARSSFGLGRKGHGRIVIYPWSKAARIFRWRLRTVESVVVRFR